MKLFSVSPESFCLKHRAVNVTGDKQEMPDTHLKGQRSREAAEGGGSCRDTGVRLFQLRFPVVVASLCQLSVVWRRAACRSHRLSSESPL